MWKKLVIYFLISGESSNKNVQPGIQILNWLMDYSEFPITTHNYRVLSFCNFVYYSKKLTNLEERINTWHKTKLYAFPKRVFKISAKKIQKHERTVINTYGIKLEFLGLGGIYKLRWQGFWLFLTTYSPKLTFSTLQTLTKSLHFWKHWQKVYIFGLPMHLFLST